MSLLNQLEQFTVKRIDTLGKREIAYFNILLMSSRSKESDIQVCFHSAELDQEPEKESFVKGDQKSFGSPLVERKSVLVNVIEGCLMEEDSTKVDIFRGSNSTWSLAKSEQAMEIRAANPKALLVGRKFLAETSDNSLVAADVN